MNLIDRVSKFIGFERSLVERIAKGARKSYSEYYKPKKKGGQRKILHPSKEVKSIQYGLIHLIFERIEVHEIAKAYIHGVSSPIRKNVELHKDYKYSIKVDFKDFFPSIRPRDLFKTIKESKIKNEFKLTDETKRFLKLICYYQDGGKEGLPIGSPSSPFISNIVMKEFDEALQSLAKSLNKDSTVTRYADDIVFSVNKKGLCNKFYDEFKEFIKHHKSPSLRLNYKKTAFMSKGCKRMINGLIITPEGKISIGRKQKRYIKKLVYDYTNGETSEEDQKYLKGYLSYILDVEPNFYNSLTVKYGPIVNTIRTN